MHSNDLPRHQLCPLSQEEETAGARGRDCDTTGLPTIKDRPLRCRQMGNIYRRSTGVFC